MDYIKPLRSMVGHEKVLMVVSGAFVFDKENRVLMQKRSDNGQWGFPGGFMELGEIVREFHCEFVINFPYPNDLEYYPTHLSE